MPWKPGNHHWIPQRGKWAKEHPDLYNETYKGFTTHLLGEEHQQVQHDEKEFGPIGSAARFDQRRWNKISGVQFPEGDFETEDLADEN